MFMENVNCSEKMQFLLYIQWWWLLYGISEPSEQGYRAKKRMEMKFFNNNKRNCLFIKIVSMFWVMLQTYIQTYSGIFHFKFNFTFFSSKTYWQFISDVIIIELQWAFDWRQSIWRNMRSDKVQLIKKQFSIDLNCLFIQFLFIFAAFSWGRNNDASDLWMRYMVAGAWHCCCFDRAACQLFFV